MRSTRTTKPYWKMTADELAEATKEFDRPIPPSQIRPLTREQRARWERTRNQSSRSVYILDRGGKGQDVVLVRLDSELLRRGRDCARDHGLSWDQFIEKSLRGALAVLEAPRSNAKRKSA